MRFNVIEGTDRNDRLVGGARRDLIEGLGGNDVLRGKAGNDVLFGGDGNDRLIGNAGNDLLRGDEGDDRMLGGGGDDTMVWRNGDGSDTMNGGRGEDTAAVEGSEDAGDRFVVSSAPGGGVHFARTNFGQFSLDITNTERLEIEGLGGNDLINARRLDAGDIALFVSGGDGDDRIIGSQGDDVLVGDRGNDRMNGGNGDDRMIWNNGDGSDRMNGGRGHDVAEVNGSEDDGDAFEAVENANGRVSFERTNLGPFSIKIAKTEVLELNGLGGDDTLDASGLQTVSAELSGGDGNDLLEGGAADDVLDGGAGDDELVGNKGNDVMRGGDGDDEMEWNNGDGSDTMDGGIGEDTAEVNGADGAGDAFEVTNGADGGVFFQRTNLGPFTIDIVNTETLELNGLGGDDTIDASGLDAGRANLEIDGGAGNDVLLGSAGDDVLLGGDGDDELVGNRGDDVMSGGDGDDEMEWNNGDGSDTMDGGIGEDTAEVNGADGAGDAFEVTNGADGGVFFQRTNLGPFTIDIVNTETLELNGLGGDDTIDASGLDAGRAIVEFDGGDGNDLLIGSAGDDILAGEFGDDTMRGGAGDDTMEWDNGDGSDVMDGGEGFDTVVVEGNDAGGDLFRISSQLTGGVLFERQAVGPFTLDIVNSEVLEVDGLGGDDTIDANDLGIGDIQLRASGGEGNDVIIGSVGDDFIDGGAGDDQLFGGTGADVFIYEEGADVIADFEDGVDLIGAEFAAALSIEQLDADTVIDFGDGNVLTLQDTLAANITEADFVF